jgi:hypothetical protein
MTAAAATISAVTSDTISSVLSVQSRALLATGHSLQLQARPPPALAVLTRQPAARAGPEAMTAAAATISPAVSDTACSALSVESHATLAAPMRRQPGPAKLPPQGRAGHPPRAGHRRPDPVLHPRRNPRPDTGTAIAMAIHPRPCQARPLQPSPPLRPQLVPQHDPQLLATSPKVATEAQTTKRSAALMTPRRASAAAHTMAEAVASHGLHTARQCKPSNGRFKFVKQKATVSAPRRNSGQRPEILSTTPGVVSTQIGVGQRQTPSVGTQCRTQRTGASRRGSRPKT